MTTRITVLRNGPLRIESDEINMVDADNNEYGLGGRRIISLCRCGASMNKPYCDGSHRSIGFSDRATAFELAPKTSS